ncbi:MAG: hypothetical protein ABI577_16305, partial [bacterium]
MSKEIAQTFGGKRIAWLIAIVAAFAVFATLGTQWQKSDAALLVGTPTIVQAPASGTVPGGSQVTFTASINVTASANNGSLAVNLPTGYTLISTTSGGSETGGTRGAAGGTCTLTGTSTGAGTFTCAVLAQVQNTSGVLAGATATATEGSNTATSTATAGVTVVGVTGTAGVGAAGGTAPVTFTLPIGITYCSDATGAGARAFTAPDQTVVGLTVVSTTPTTAVDTAAGTHTVVVSDDATPGGTVSLSTHVSGLPAGTGCVFTVVTVTAANFAVPEIRHIPDTVGPHTSNPNLTPNTGTVIPQQELNNNVRGSRHTICLVAQNTGIDGADAGTLQDAPAVPVMIPGITLANIAITNGGSPSDPSTGLPLAGTPTFTDVRIFTGDGTATGYGDSTATAGLLGATCVSWVSTEAGDQQINIVYVGLDGLQYNASWDSDGDGNGQAVKVNRAIIKEWNRLQGSGLTYEGVSQLSATGAFIQNITKTVSLVLNPATGFFQMSTPGQNVSIDDVFYGNHINSAGVLEGTPLPIALAGVSWIITSTGCSASLDGNLTGVTVLNPDGSVGNQPSVDVFAGTCLPGQSVVVTFTGTEPGPLGSGLGTTITETVTLTFTQNIAEKQVFLAWAGQRIILEHDWRLAPGDENASPVSTDGPNPNGTCPFFGNRSTQLAGQQAEAVSIIPIGGSGDFVVQYVKGGGPGNFVAGLDAFVDGSDQAYVSVGASDNSQTLQTGPSSDNDIIGDPQDNCISRVLYESEDPGEVDIEAFAYDNFELSGNYTKVAFVIYYMKINTINVSLVTQVSKPTHNSSIAADYAAGGVGANPWDASKDDADNAADWNVSKDLLVRGRVTGWFVNSNPSGRAADTSNPLNVLPANRWVMPQDWPLLAGGPADPADGSDAIGTAEQFRPYYDIMFAPNNARGIALGTPEGAFVVQLTFVSAASGTGSSAATAIKVASCSDLPVGRTIFVGTSTTPRTVVSCAAGSLVITPAVSAGPSIGTGIYFFTGVPFEGPYSLLDIVGLDAEGKGGAALSNWIPGSIRDTANDDGDVDMWDAPMPPAPVSIAIRGTGFIKQVIKDEVYYLGTPNTTAQIYTNPFYISNIPDSPFIPAVVAGGGYLWNSWGNDGPGGAGQGVYRFWTPAVIGTNSEGFGDSFTAAQTTELGAIRAAYGDLTIARDLVVFSDNHGEFMVTANGDYRTDLTACATNVLAGGKHCKTGDKVGTGSITATVDYPDFRGKHFPVLSNTATVTWLWGGYKDVTVEAGETDQYKYIVFHGMDRDGFCSALGTGAILLHPVLSALDALSTVGSVDPVETVDFLIDSGEGIVIGGSGGSVNDGKQFATGLPTFSVTENDPAVTGIKEFPLSSLAGAGQTDECQAWIKVSNSLLGVLNVLAIAHDDEGNIGFDKIIDLTNTTSYTLNFRWSLITWAGADSISVNDAIKGTGTSGKNPGGNDISASVTAIYGWDASAQQWLGFFP